MRLYLLCAVITIMISACTYSIVVSQAGGNGTDTVDEKQDASPTVSPDVTIPAV